LARKLGDEGPALQALARGLDPRRVTPDRAAKSIGAEDTFEVDLVDGPELRRAVMAQADRVAERLRAHELVAKTVVLKLKDTAFQSRTRQRALAAASSDGRLLAQIALALLDEAKVRAPGVRLSGVAVHGLAREEAPRQLALEPRAGKGDRLMKALDAIKGKFGRGAIDRAELIGEDREARRAQRRGDALGGDYDEDE
jgi:DNA polymerase-4